MQTIKFLPNNQIRLNKTTYKGYHIGDIPKSFGFIYNQDTEQEGKSQWFNYKGLTYVEKTELPW